ncbi:MAG: mitochondrial ATPase complex subunit ATP10 [Desulfobacterota bacterium]|nr:mitochondrial ATPase complex subunit ATP10 [Thermodesulfobacteriota bacterium]
MRRFLHQTICIGAVLIVCAAGDAARGGQAMASTNIGKRFPTVTGSSLAGDKESIPDSCRGKVTLITVAFLRENQGQLDSWLNPFYEKFGNNPGFMFYEIPMISSGYKFMKMIIDGGMRAGLPSFKHKHVVTMYGDVAHYLEQLSLDPRHGYAFLLDRDGVIRFQAQGFATPQLLQELFTLAETLAAQPQRQ